MPTPMPMSISMPTPMPMPMANVDAIALGQVAGSAKTNGPMQTHNTKPCLTVARKERNLPRQGACVHLQSFQCSRKRSRRGCTAANRGFSTPAPRRRSVAAGIRSESLSPLCPQSLAPTAQQRPICIFMCNVQSAICSAHSQQQQRNSRV